MNSSTRYLLLLIHPVNHFLEVLIDNRTFQFQCVCKLSTLHREVMSKERKALYLLIRSQALLQRLYTFHHHFMNFLPPTPLTRGILVR